MSSCLFCPCNTIQATPRSQSDWHKHGEQHNLSRLINRKHVNLKADVSFLTKNEPKTLRLLTFLCGYRYAKYNFKRWTSVDFPHRAGLIIIHSYGGWGLLLRLCLNVLLFACRGEFDPAITSRSVYI